MSDRSTHKKSRLPYTVLALGCVSFLTDFSSEMIYPLLPVFLTVTLGASASLVGLIEGIAEATASLVKVFSGSLSDRLSKRKPLVIFGYAISSALRPLMSVAVTPYQVLAIRVGDRLGKGVRSPPRDALIATICPADIRGRAFGFHRAMDHMGAIVGPLVATILLSLAGFSYREVFAWAAVPGILAVGVLILFVKEKAGAVGQYSSKSIGLNWNSFSQLNGTLKRYLLILGLFTLSNSTDAFLLLKAQQTGVHIKFIPILWLWLHVTKSFSSVPGGNLSDLFGRKRVIATGWIIYAAVYIGFAFASQAWQIWALFGVYGLYYGLTEAPEKALLADLATKKQEGISFGIYHGVIGLVALPSSLWMGIVWDRFGNFTAFLTAASLALLATLLLVTKLKLESREA